MRRRPSARLIVTDPDGRVLLFRFSDQTRASGAATYWATPGGGLEAGESFEQAALRELREETGFETASVGNPVAHREAVITWFDGEPLLADERYFRVAVGAGVDVSRAGWTADESDVIAEHRWWSLDELMQTAETVFPENLIAMLRSEHKDNV